MAGRCGARSGGEAAPPDGRRLASESRFRRSDVGCLDLAVDEADLDPAFATRVLREDDAVVRFDHPLLAAVAYNGLPPVR